jgi:hypothetical protein
VFTQSIFQDGKHTNMTMKNNWDFTDPGFTGEPTNSDSIKAFLHAQFYGTGVPVDWSWDGGVGATYTQYAFPWDPTKVGFIYRTPENLAYSNATVKTLATGNFPAGDLNWWPTQKAAWLLAGGSATDKTALDALPGGYEAPKTTAVKPVGGGTPLEYRLEANYPNPFNPSTTIKYTVAQAGMVKLAIYDILGREVRSLVNTNMPAGDQSVQWDGRDLNGKTVSSGVYFYKLQAGSFVSTKKMMLLK